MITEFDGKCKSTLTLLAVMINNQEAGIWVWFVISQMVWETLPADNQSSFIYVAPFIQSPNAGQSALQRDWK